MFKRAFVFSLISLAAVSTPVRAASLAGSEWGLSSSDQRYVQFRSGGKVSGFAGCNRFFASYTAGSHKLRIGQIGSTRKYCGKTAMKREREWFGLLRRIRSYEATHLKLTLYGAKRAVLVVLRRRDWD